MRDDGSVRNEPGRTFSLELPLGKPGIGFRSGCSKENPGSYDDGLSLWVC
jgi:hypothetical protein